MKALQQIVLGGLVAVALAPAVARAERPCGLVQHGEFTSRDNKERVWMQTGKDAIRDRLKDGPAARFRDVYFCRGVTGNIPMTCGWVNGKNSFGAYGGFQRFISAGRGDLSFLESQVKGGFSSTWNMMCR